MSTLRARTIRLAHTNPELQPLLLPLLKQAALPGVHYEQDITAAAKSAQATMDRVVKKLRDLAGKMGKTKDPKALKALADDFNTVFNWLDTLATSAPRI